MYQHVFVSDGLKRSLSIHTFANHSVLSYTCFENIKSRVHFWCPRPPQAQFCMKSGANPCRFINVKVAGFQPKLLWDAEPSSPQCHPPILLTPRLRNHPFLPLLSPSNLQGSRLAEMQVDSVRFFLDIANDYQSRTSRRSYIIYDPHRMLNIFLGFHFFIGRPVPGTGALEPWPLEYNLTTDHVPIGENVLQHHPCRMCSKASHFTPVVWAGGQRCVRWTLHLRPQPSATVRNRSQLFATVRVRAS